jgi:ubiquinone/menaquinone biosynthesis C-methylase UbiE
MRKRMGDDLLNKFNRVESFHWWWEGRRELVREFLAGMPVKKGKLLDVGCGTGETMLYVRKKFKDWDIFGVDVSREAVNYAKKRGFAKTFLGNADALPFKANQFDAILLLDVIEHLDDSVSSVLEMKRVLKPGGKILVTCPALKIIWSKHDEGQGHVMRYERKEMRTLALETEMELVRVKYFNFVLSLPIIAIRLLGKLPGFGFLVSYDNGMNYEMAAVKPINDLLRWIFVKEISLLGRISYPWGISILAEVRKPLSRSSASSQNKARR